MHRDLCGGRPSLCDAMKPTKGADLLKYLRKVEFKGKSKKYVCTLGVYMCLLTVITLAVN